MPKHYPGYRFGQDQYSRSASCDYNEGWVDLELHEWYKRTRVCVRDKVFTMFPHIASEYYTKRAAHVKENEEHRLRAMIMASIPVGEIGWKDDFHKPRIMIKQPGLVEPRTPELKPTAAGELTPPLTPIENARDNERHLSDFVLPVSASLPPAPWNVVLFLDPLPRDPPILCMPHPPPANMSQEAKLLCLARWTLFDPIHGTPYLLSSPRDKDFEMDWTSAKYLGASDQILIEWAKEMWWHTWIRQSHTNYVGMWKKRLKKEDSKAEKRRAEEEMRTKSEKLIKARLKALNLSFGFIEKN